MTEESKENLLMAYRAAVAGKMTSIADLLEDVILEVMGGEKPSMVTIGATDETRPSWCTKGPIVVNTADAVRDWDDGE